MPRRGWYAASVLLLVLTGVCIACASRTSTTASSQPRPPERSASGGAESLEARVTSYWNLRKSKDLSGMYEFYCPEYRSRVSRTEFLSMTRLVRFTINRFQIANTAVNGDKADVKVTLWTSVPTISQSDLQSTASEVWVKEKDGRWYKADEPLVLPFPRQ